MQVGSDKWDSPVFLFLCNCGDESFYELYNIALTALDDVWLEWESCGYMDFPVVIAYLQKKIIEAALLRPKSMIEFKSCLNKVLFPIPAALKEQTQKK